MKVLKCSTFDQQALEIARHCGIAPLSLVRCVSQLLSLTCIPVTAAAKLSTQGPSARFSTGYHTFLSRSHDVILQSS